MMRYYEQDGTEVTAADVAEDEEPCDGSGEHRACPSGDPQDEVSWPCHGCEECEDD